MNSVQIVLLIIQIFTLIALVVYVEKTWEMASATRRVAEISEKTLQEMRSARDQEVAPYVVAYLDVPRDNRQLYLIIKNTGKTMATNVKVVFEPPLQTPYQELLNRILSKDGIPSIPPGYEIRTIIDSFPKYKVSGPMRYTVSLNYYGGITIEPRTAEFILDLELHRGTVSINDV